MSVYLPCVSWIRTCTVYGQCPWRPEEGPDTLELKLQKLGPLQEWSVITEPPVLWTPFTFLTVLLTHQCNIMYLSVFLYLASLS